MGINRHIYAEINNDKQHYYIASRTYNENEMLKELFEQKHVSDVNAKIIGYDIITTNTQEDYTIDITDIQSTDTINKVAKVVDKLLEQITNTMQEGGEYLYDDVLVDIQINTSDKKQQNNIFVGIPLTDDEATITHNKEFGTDYLTTEQFIKKLFDDLFDVLDTIKKCTFTVTTSYAPEDK